MKIRVVIQARTSSTRLPGKVLKHIGGMPLALLVARRASRSGFDVVVATSDDASDDALATALASHGIKVFRGPLLNVLARFIGATEDLSDDSICVRLTADNPVPDADLVQLTIDKFLSTQAEYISYGNDGQFLPYGASVEVFRVAGLRRTLSSNPDAQTCEHVTTKLRALADSYRRPALPGIDKDLGHLRCTVDTAADFAFMSRLFAGISDPVAIGWLDLVELLRVASPENPEPRPVLGTVQLGLAYGRTNQTGMPSDISASTILASAYDRGIRLFDTARDYGVSENRLGDAIRANSLSGATVITKLTPRTQSTTHGSDTNLRAFVAREVEESIFALGLERIPVLLLHRTSDLDFANGAVWHELLALQSSGKIDHLGCSVQSPAELDRALSEPAVKYVQMPFNILDWRWEKSIAGLRLRPDVEVHARSAFLQGLLVGGDAKYWPRIDGLNSENLLRTFGKLADEFGRKSIADLCIAYVRAMSWVGGIVIGVENLQQLSENFDLWFEPQLSWEQVAELRSKLPLVPAELLNPALWPPR